MNNEERRRAMTMTFEMLEQGASVNEIERAIGHAGLFVVGWRDVLQRSADRLGDREKAKAAWLYYWTTDEGLAALERGEGRWELGWGPDKESPETA